MAGSVATMLFAAAAALAILVPGQVEAREFQRVATEAEFSATVVGRSLSRMGIRLNVTPDGDITGRAFGRDVTGEWTWQSGHFCRTLRFGGSDLGYNCQMVLRDGNTVRFIADEGRGDFADLRLR